MNDKQYLNTVKDYLPWLLDLFNPDLVLYDAGVDPHQDDALGKLNLTDQGTVKECSISNRWLQYLGVCFTLLCTCVALFSSIYGRRFPIDSALAWDVVYSDIYAETRNSRTPRNTPEQPWNNPENREIKSET